MVSGMGIYGLVVLRIIYPALRWLGWAIVLFYVVALLGVRYVLFPKVEHYRPYIEAQLSSLFDGRVELGHIRADWHRLNPRIEISQVWLHDHRGVRVMTVPHLAAVVSWRSLLSLTPQFASVHAAGIDLSVRRDARGQLWLMGRNVGQGSVDAPAPESSDDAMGERTIRWLADQPQIRLYDTTLRWIDESRSQQALVLQDVDLKIRNRGRQHQFSLTARPAEAIGGHFDMRGNFLRSSEQARPLALETGTGQLYVHVEDMRPQAWQPWIDWPDFLHSERVSIQTWFDVGHGDALNLTTDVRVNNARWTSPGTAALNTGQARVFATGPWPDFQEGRLDFSLQAHDVAVTLPEAYDQPVRVQGLSARGSTARSEGLSLQLDDFTLYNRDIALEGALRWIPAAGMTADGHVDVTAQVSRARLDAVHRYMPRSVSHDVRDWLEQGLLAGEIHDARLILRGDLSDFPFADGQQGEFRIQGAFRDTVIDYLPEEEGSVGWPRLDALYGQIELDRTALSITADRGQIEPAEGALIQLRDIDALIDDLQDDPILHVGGHTRGDAATYMAFLQRSDLNGMLNHAFDSTSAQGAWELPLALTIPLSRSIDSRVEGTIQIADGRIHIDPAYPAFEDVSGEIAFTEEEVSIPGLSARFLNGNVQLSGGTGPAHEGLRMSGQVDAKALRTLYDAPGMSRLDGKTAYVATLSGIGREQQGLKLSLNSDLQGMALDFPAPLNKAADVAWPLAVSWAHGEGAARSLDVILNRSMQANFIRRGATGPYFDAGRVGVGRVAEPIDTGMNVDIEHPVFDGDAWDAITREFDSPDISDGEGTFPEIRSLRVQTAQGRLLGLPLDQLTYTMKQQDANGWRADISSTQTAGTLNWTRENGVIQGPVQAVFHRLAYGHDSAEDTDESEADESEGLPVDEELRIPAINLIVENLKLYGRDVGKLALVGVNEDQGDTWRLEQFALSSPSAHLEGRGVWRLRGPDRGLTLDAEADVSDLGDYFDQIGFKDVLSAGAGMVEIDINWHDLPWRLDVSEIDGRISFEFTKGRLSTMNSRSARLLELISLQSMRRLATLDLNPLTLTQEGFPYDVLRGVLRLEQGSVHTEDYRIVGPVGTIVLDGLVQLKTGKLDLQAVVVPNLDVSGAAIAAGVAINPVVGIGAFLTQWLLKAPLAAAMTAQYKIGGDWDQPDIQAVERIRDQDDP